MQLGNLKLCEASQPFSCTVQEMAAPSWPGEWAKAWQERVVAAELAPGITLEHLRHPLDRMLQRMGGHAYCQYPFGGVSVGSDWPDPWAKGIDLNRYMLLSLRTNGKPIALCSFADAKAVLRHHAEDAMLARMEKAERKHWYYEKMMRDEPDEYDFYFDCNPAWGMLPKVYEGIAWRPLEWLPPHGLDFYGNAGGTRYNVPKLTAMMAEWWQSLETPDWAAELGVGAFNGLHIERTAEKLQQEGVI